MLSIYNRQSFWRTSRELKKAYITLHQHPFRLGKSKITRRVSEEYILDVGKYHSDRLPIKQRQHAAIKYLQSILNVNADIQAQARKSNLDDELEIPYVGTFGCDELKYSLCALESAADTELHPYLLSATLFWWYPIKCRFVHQARPGLQWLLRNITRPTYKRCTH